MRVEIRGEEVKYGRVFGGWNHFYSKYNNVKNGKTPLHHAVTAHNPVRKLSLKHMNDYGSFVMMQKNTGKSAIITSEVWVDSIDPYAVKSIMLDDVSYRVKDISMSTSGTYIFSTDKPVPNAEYVQGLWYQAVSDWMKWYYPDHDTFASMVDAKDVPCDLEKQIRDAELEEIKEKLDEAIESSISKEVEKIERPKPTVIDEKKEEESSFGILESVLFSSLLFTIFRSLGWI